MLNLWTSLNWPQMALLGLAVIGLSFGVLPVLIRRFFIFAEHVWSTLNALLMAAWPAFDVARKQLADTILWQRVMAKARRLARPEYTQQRNFSKEDAERLTRRREHARAAGQ